jgi:site-specific DNA recombinase
VTTTHLRVTAEQKLLKGRKQQLLNERAKLLQAHYAEAVPLDLLRTEQTRIANQLAYLHVSSTGGVVPDDERCC